MVGRPKATLKKTADKGKDEEKSPIAAKQSPEPPASVAAPAPTAPTPPPPPPRPQAARPMTMTRDESEEEIAEPSGKTLLEAKNRWTELKRMGMKELINKGLELGLPEPRLLRKQALVFSILEKETGEGGNIYAEGVLEVMDEGYGFLRSPDHSYVAGPDDVYV